MEIFGLKKRTLPGKRGHIVALMNYTVDAKSVSTQLCHQLWDKCHTVRSYMHLGHQSCNLDDDAEVIQMTEK
jgi:hypothetical protein